MELDKVPPRSCADISRHFPTFSRHFPTFPDISRHFPTFPAFPDISRRRDFAENVGADFGIWYLKVQNWICWCLVIFGKSQIKLTFLCCFCLTLLALFVLVLHRLHNLHLDCMYMHLLVCTCTAPLHFASRDVPTNFLTQALYNNKIPGLSRTFLALNHIILSGFSIIFQYHTDKIETAVYSGLGVHRTNSILGIRPKK